MSKPEKNPFKPCTDYPYSFTVLHEFNYKITATSRIDRDSVMKMKGINFFPYQFSALTRIKIDVIRRTVDEWPSAKITPLVLHGSNLAHKTYYYCRTPHLTFGCL